MLYLTRKIGESVIINDNIEVTVIDIRGKSIKLGFTFPPDATVLRREIFERIQAENQKTGEERDIPQAMRIHGRLRETAAPTPKMDTKSARPGETPCKSENTVRETEKAD
jgi:carbon storage regulator